MQRMVLGRIWQPRRMGYHNVTVNPKLWNTGRQPSSEADCGRIDSEEICAQLARKNAWKSCWMKWLGKFELKRCGLKPPGVRRNVLSCAARLSWRS